MKKLSRNDLQQSSSIIAKNPSTPPRGIYSKRGGRVEARLDLSWPKEARNDLVTTTP